MIEIETIRYSFQLRFHSTILIIIFNLHLINIIHSKLTMKNIR